MIELLQLILHIVASLFKSKAKLEAEILVLRQQLNVLRRQVSQRRQLNNADRFLLVWLAERKVPTTICSARARARVMGSKWMERK
jgi:hypothetical protein